VEERARLEAEGTGFGSKATDLAGEGLSSSETALTRLLETRALPGVAFDLDGLSGLSTASSPWSALAPGPSETTFRGRPRGRFDTEESVGFVGVAATREEDASPILRGVRLGRSVAWAVLVGGFPSAERRATKAERKIDM